MRLIKFITAVVLMSVFSVANSQTDSDVDDASYNSNSAIFGYELIQTAETISEFSSVTVVAECSSGKKVLGGGWALASGGDFETSSLGPTPDGAGYFLDIVSLGEEPQEVIVTAICAYVSRKPN
jgi:hypothetical protein